LSEQADVALLLSQTKYNWLLAAVEADVDGARYDMVAQCCAGGQPKLQIGPPQHTYEVVLTELREMMVLAG